MSLSVSHCFITVHDHDAALGFYCKGLGLEVKNDVKSPAGRWVTLVAPDRPEVDIVLSGPGDGRPADEQTMLELLTKGSLPGVFFTTDDLDATFEKLRSTGAEVMQEPMDQPWGPRDCAFRDPSGTMIRINQA